VTRGYPLDSCIVKDEIKRAESMGLDLEELSMRSLVLFYFDDLKAIQVGKKNKEIAMKSHMLRKHGVLSLESNGEPRKLSARAAAILEEIERGP